MGVFCILWSRCTFHWIDVGRVGVNEFSMYTNFHKAIGKTYNNAMVSRPGTQAPKHRDQAVGQSHHSSSSSVFVWNAFKYFTIDSLAMRLKYFRYAALSTGLASPHHPAAAQRSVRPGPAIGCCSQTKRKNHKSEKNRSDYKVIARDGQKKIERELSTSSFDWRCWR